jgi:hypothetical protein
MNAFNLLMPAMTPVTVGKYTPSTVNQFSPSVKAGPVLLAINSVLHPIKPFSNKKRALKKLENSLNVKTEIS